MAKRRKIAQTGTGLERTYYTMRLLEKDKELIKSLSFDGKTRHQALLELVPIVESMVLPELPERKPMRLGLPDELFDALRDRSKLEKDENELNWPMTDLLIEAANRYMAKRKKDVESSKPRAGKTGK